MINWEICEKCPHEDKCQIFNPEDCKRYRTLDSSLSKIDNFNFNELRDAILADSQPLRDFLDSLKFIKRGEKNV